MLLVQRWIISLRTVVRNIGLHGSRHACGSVFVRGVEVVVEVISFAVVVLARHSCIQHLLVPF